MKRKLIIIVSLLYVGLMAFFFFYLHSKGESYKALVAVAGIICGAVPLHMAIFSKWNFSLGIVFSYILFLFGSQFLGNIMNWYDISWWDTFMHFISGGLLAFIALGLYERFIHVNGKGDIPPWFVFLIAFAIPALGGVLWEIYEFTTDQVFGTTLQGVGVTDTMTDLMGDVAGGLIVAIFAGVRIKIRLKAKKS